jgi:hypothetical protein
VDGAGAAFAASSGLAIDGAGAGMGGSGEGVSAVFAAESVAGGQCATVDLVSRAVSAGAMAELRPTMYPMEKNTPSRMTTIRKTLMSCRLPSMYSNSPSSFFAKPIQPSYFVPASVRGGAATFLFCASQLVENPA